MFHCTPTWTSTLFPNNNLFSRCSNELSIKNTLSKQKQAFFSFSTMISTLKYTCFPNFTHFEKLKYFFFLTCGRQDVEYSRTMGFVLKTV